MILVKITWFAYSLFVVEEGVRFFLTIRFDNGIKPIYFSISKIRSWSSCIFAYSLFVVEEEVRFFLSIRFNNGIKPIYFSVSKIRNRSSHIISPIQDMFRKLLCVECSTNAYFDSIMGLNPYIFLQVRFGVEVSALLVKYKICLGNYYLNSNQCSHYYWAYHWTQLPINTPL